MKTRNRVVTLLLVLCLMLSLAVPAVFASNDATTKYSFGYLTDASLTTTGDKPYASWPIDGADNQINNQENLNAAYANNTVNSTILYYGNSNIGAAAKVQLGAASLTVPGKAGDYVAIKIKSPGAGTYEMTFTHERNSNNAGVCDIYVLAADTAESAISGKSALTSSAKVGSVNMTSKTTSSTFEYTLGDAQEYIVLFYAAENGSKGNGYLRPIEMTFAKVGGGTQETTPQGTTSQGGTQATTPQGGAQGTTPPADNVPSTGDNSSITVMAVIMIASAAVISLVLLSDIRRKHA